MKELKTDFVGLKVTPEMKKLLRELSAKEGRTLSNYIVSQIIMKKG